MYGCTASVSSVAPERKPYCTMVSHSFLHRYDTLHRRNTLPTNLPFPVPVPLCALTSLLLLPTRWAFEYTISRTSHGSRGSAQFDSASSRGSLGSRYGSLDGDVGEAPKQIEAPIQECEGDLSAAEKVDAVGAMDASSRPGWESYIDESTGNQYWVSESTGESTWDDPS